MSIFDGLVILGVFGGLGYVLLSKMHKDNPLLIGRIKEWINKKESPKSQQNPDEIRQVYDEKRTMM